MSIVERKPPSGAEARRLQTELEQLWQNAFTRDRRMRALVNQTNRVELLPNKESLNIEPVELHTGRAGTLLEHAGSFVGALPSVAIEPVSLTTISRRDSEQAERAFQSLFYQQLVANDFWRTLGKNMLQFGRGILSALPLPSQWTAQEGFPVRGNKEPGKSYNERVNAWKHETGKLPFVITTTSPDDVLLKLDSNDKALISLETKMVTAQEVAEGLESAEVAELLARGTLKWYDLLPILQYIDDANVCYYLTSTSPIKPGYFQGERDYFTQTKPYKRLKSWAHGLGRCPVVFIPGVKTDEREYELRFKPFLADAEESLETFDFLMSRLATLVKAFYFPSFEWKLGLPSNQFAGQDRPLEEVNIGGVTTTYIDEVLKPLEMSQNLPPADMLVSQLDALIQRNTLEDVLFGRVEGSSAAFAIRLRINVAKNKLIPRVTHMAQGLVEVLDLVGRAVEQLNESVIINGEELTVAMAKQAHGRTSVNVNPKLPGEEGIELGQAQMATELNLPEDWIWEHILGIADPATLRMLRDVLQLEKLPDVEQRLMLDALNRLQTLVEDDETEAIFDALERRGANLDPEVIQALQRLVGQTPGQEGGGVPPPPGAPEGGVGRGPFPPGGSPQAVGGGRGLGTPNSPRPSQQFVEPAETGTQG